MLLFFLSTFESPFEFILQMQAVVEAVLSSLEVQGVQTTQFFHLAFHNTVANHSSSGRQLVSLNTDVLTELSAINSDETIGQQERLEGNRFILFYLNWGYCMYWRK